MNTTVEEIFELLPSWLADLCLYALRISGVKPFFGKPEYQNIPAAVETRAEEIVKDVCRNCKDLNKNDGSSWVKRNYLPDLDEDFVATVLGVSRMDAGMRFTSSEGLEWRYDYYGDVGKFKCFDAEKGKYCHERACYWIARVFKIQVYELFDAYFRWKYGDKKPLNNLLRKSKPITNAMLVEYLKTNGVIGESVEVPSEDEEAPVKVAVGETIDVENWKAEKPFGGNLTRIKSFFKNADGYVDDRTCKTRYGNRWVYTDRDPRQQKNVDAVKDELVRKGMHKAINRPRKGYGVDAKRKAYITEGVYTLTGSSNNSGTSKVVVARLSRFVGKTGAEAKRFAKGSEPVPFLLDQIAMKHGKLWVCEGVPDAVFVKNGIALNNWKPTELEQSIIDHYAKDRVGKRTMKGLRVAYITDNWVVGDKGAVKALDYYKKYAPETLVFDWSEFCSDHDVKAKDLGELVMDFVGRGERGFITADGDYCMPEELLERYTKPARDIHHSFAMTFDELFNQSKYNNL